MKNIQRGFALPILVLLIVAIGAGVQFYAKNLPVPAPATTKAETPAPVAKKAEALAPKPSDTVQVKVVDTTPNVVPTATPVTGSVPLSVRFVIPDVPGVDYEGLGIYYTIVFGDGQAAGFSRKPPFYITHTYSKVGPYKAVISVATMCGSWECVGGISKEVATFNIFVNSGLTQ